MPPDTDDRLAQQLLQLRHEYLRDSGARVDELRQLRNRLATEQRAVLADFRQAFHRLAGSGGSYGFPEVSARSREGETIIVSLQSAGADASPADLTTLDRCIDSVAAAFSEARMTLDHNRQQVDGS